MQQQEKTTEPHELLTVRMFAQRFPAWTEAALRNLILNSTERHNSRGERIPSNGLAEARAVVRVGRRVLIDVHAFFGPWIAMQQKQRKSV